MPDASSERREGGVPNVPRSDAARGARGALASELLGTSRELRSRSEFWEPRYESRRLFSEVFGTFLLVFVAVGAGMVGARFGGDAVPASARAVAPGLMVMSIILFMGGVSGAHLNPCVTIAFAMRRDFPWRRVPGYVVAQFVGAVVASGLLVALLGSQGSSGLTLPGVGVAPLTAMLWETVLTTGLISVILGTSSGAQSVSWGAAIGVGGYIALAGLIGAPVSGASMNVTRSLAPALVAGDLTAWWVYVAGPLLGALLAVGIAWILRGAGGGIVGRRAASGTLGDLWIPGSGEPSHDQTPAEKNGPEVER